MNAVSSDKHERVHWQGRQYSLSPWPMGVVCNPPWLTIAPDQTADADVDIFINSTEDTRPDGIRGSHRPRQQPLPWSPPAL